MISPGVFLAQPFEFNKINIYPPKVNDVLKPLFWSLYKVLSLSQEEIEDELYDKDKDEMKTQKIPTPLEFLLINAYHDESYRHLVEQSFQFFCHTEILLLYDTKQILIGSLEVLKNVKTPDDLIILDENNFFDFQNYIRQAVGETIVERPNPDEDPRVKRIKAKARYRDKVKAKLGLGLKLTTCLAAICCMNMGLNPLNIGEISYASINILMRTYQEKEKYATDIDSVLAGADKIHPIYWIRNLD